MLMNASTSYIPQIDWEGVLEEPYVTLPTRVFVPGSTAGPPESPSHDVAVSLTGQSPSARRSRRPRGRRERRQCANYA